MDTTTTPAVSPLRQRMIEDMRMRKLETKTQQAYIRAVLKLSAYLKRSPDTATAEDLRGFQLHLVDTGSSPVTLNATLSGLKFFFDVTLDQGHLLAKMQPVHIPRTLPVVLSRDEVSRLLAAAPNFKHQTALTVAYATGLRASEVISLKVGAGHTALFITAGNLLGELAALDSDSALQRKLRQYAAPDLLLIDEVGYLSYSNRHADLLFELVSRRYQHKSTVVTTNRAFAEWGEVFPNAACVVSLIDRLMHRAEVVRIDGASYRAKEADERQALRKAERAAKAPASRSRKVAR